MVASQKLTFITGQRMGFQEQPYSSVPFVRAKEYSLFLQKNEASQLFYLNKIKPLFDSFEWDNLIASLNMENGIIVVEVPYQ